MITALAAAILASLPIQYDELTITSKTLFHTRYFSGFIMHTSLQSSAENFALVSSHVRAAWVRPGLLSQRKHRGAQLFSSGAYKPLARCVSLPVGCLRY